MSTKIFPCRGCGAEPFLLEACNQLKCADSDCAYSEMGARPFDEWQRLHAPSPQWQPGPPTEPGNYITKWKQSPAQFCEWTADDLKAQVALTELIECHYGPIPIPQPPEVTP